jgi:hypothetical protein
VVDKTIRRLHVNSQWCKNEYEGTKGVIVYRMELSKPDTSLLQNSGTLEARLVPRADDIPWFTHITVHVVSLRVNDFRDSNLGDLHCAC